ncbi:MAG: alternative ribosome rescue aminoacyl-tRNA hydrolase ArfB [Leeuwenhoekiella sp.]
MNKEALLAECTFKAVRSSGPGGQHVNKTSTKVVLTWSLPQSLILNEEQKNRLSDKLANKLTKDETIIISYDNSRSQLKNKEEVKSIFISLIERALHKPKARRKTKPTHTSRLKRLDSKKKKAQKKFNRKSPPLD